MLKNHGNHISCNFETINFMGGLNTRSKDKFDYYTPNSHQPNSRSKNLTMAVASKHPVKRIKENNIWAIPTPDKLKLRLNNTMMASYMNNVAEEESYYTSKNKFLGAMTLNSKEKKQLHSNFTNSESYKPIIGGSHKSNTSLPN